MHANSPSSNASSNALNVSTSASSEAPPDAGLVVQDELVSSTTTISATSTVDAPPSAGASGGTKISFSVTRRETSRVVAGARNKLGGPKRGGEYEEEEDYEEEHGARKRGVLSLEDGVAIDAEAPRPKREKKVFVIPVLRLSNQSQIGRLKKLVEEGTATEADRARLELLLESVGDETHQRSSTGGKQKIDLLGSGQPSGPTVVVADDVVPDYESMPVGVFGLAFLRGCGWKDAQSCIGKSNAQAVPLRVTAPRPKGLGLGAVLPSTAPPTPAGSNDEEREKPLGRQSYVKCLGGLNKGALGQVTSMDEENASVFVELAWPPSSVGKTVRVSQLAVEVVPRKEFRDRLKAAARGTDGVEMANGRSGGGRDSRRIRV